MRRRAASLAFALVGLSGCSPVSHYVSRQYYPAQQRSVIVFSPFSAVLDETGLAAVAGAAEAALQDPDATVQVAGYSSTADTDVMAKQLAEARAQAVENQLIVDGVPFTRVTGMERGATTYQFSPEEAQRVEIVIVRAGF